MTHGDGTRNAERTRGEILDAARRVLAERGTALTIQDVASAAGVSKSGLLHHFSSRDELLRAVVVRYVERMRAGVLEHLDSSENHPGRVLRAYVRALCGPDSPARMEYASIADIGHHLSRIPGVTELLDADSAEWRRLFAEDGLDPDTILLVRYAAEGIAIATGYDEVAVSQDLGRAGPLLLALTEGDRSWGTTPPGDALPHPRA